MKAPLNHVSLFLIISLLTLTVIKAAQSDRGDAKPVRDVQKAATEFIALLGKGDFNGAFSRFDSAMRSAMPEEKLKTVWEGLQSQAGGFQKQLRTYSFSMAGYDVVRVTCQFERLALDAKVAFNSQGQISGLYFLPASPPAPSGMPAYADTNAFYETEVQVGRQPWLLPGTLTLPKEHTKPVPAVVLVHGSGPLDRNETVGANQPFRDLAWGLATRGIAVLRYEKRTKEHGRKLKASEVTLYEETVEDATLAVNFLQRRAEIAGSRVFVLGHSLGALAAPRIAEASTNVAGLVMLAAPARPLDVLVLEQTRYLISLSSNPTAEEQKKLQSLETEVAKITALSTNEASGQLLLGAPARYWLDLRCYDAVSSASKLTIPILILQGERDYQVTDADFSRWKASLGLQARVTLKLFPELNHLFIAGKGKSTPAEYEQPGHVDESVVAEIIGWVLNK